MKNLPPKTLALVVVAAAVAAAASAYLFLSMPSLKVEESYSDLKLTAQVSKGDYSRGEPVAVAIVLRYDPNAANPMSTGWDSSQRFNILVYDEGGRLVYNWSAHQTFKHEYEVYVVTFTAGMKIEQTITWNQKDDAGQQVPAGKYKIVITTPEFIYRYAGGYGYGPQVAGLPQVLVTITTKPIEVTVR
ncbi:MAG: BsuPI-related putative proteinase inhibitor [Candidatus Bathyarchaeia archaeon]